VILVIVGSNPTGHPRGLLVSPSEEQERSIR
jgi:hypothetical protein